MTAVKKRFTPLSAIVVALVLGIALALVSVRFERIGPEQVQYGNLCGPSTFGPCYKPALKGGFPLPYLYDAPGVSRERQLAFFEDNFTAGALVIDIAVYFSIVLVAIRGISRRRS